MTWEPHEVPAFLHNQLDVDAREFGLIEDTIGFALMRSDAAPTVG